MIPQMKINFKQPKYVLPAVLYFPLLGLGYLIIDIFHTEIPEEVQSDLQTTEYLNAELPSANVKDGLGGKRENVEKTFGNIRDLSAMENIENDLDSVKKKEDFESNYTEKDLEELAKNAKSKAERDRYLDMRNKLQKQADDARDQSGADFLKDISDEERAKIDALRHGLEEYGGILESVMRRLDVAEKFCKEHQLDMTQNKQWADLIENNIGLHVLYIYLDSLTTFLAFCRSECFAEYRQNLAYLVISSS